MRDKMIEYIKKQDVIDELMDYASRWFAYDPYNKIVAIIFQDVELTIKGIPSTELRHASTLDIVRCKECKHWWSDGGAIMFCEQTDFPTDADDFCSYGERKESE